MAIPAVAKAGRKVGGMLSSRRARTVHQTGHFDAAAFGPDSGCWLLAPTGQSTDTKTAPVQHDPSHRRTGPRGLANPNHPPTS